MTTAHTLHLRRLRLCAALAALTRCSSPPSGGTIFRDGSVDAPSPPDTPAPIDARTDTVSIDLAPTDTTPTDTTPPDAPPPSVRCASASSASPLSAETTQVIRVTTPSWTDAHGTLERFERTPGGAWTSVGSRIPVAIGRTGMGWGRGLHGQGPPVGCEGPGKREGDGRSPAGVFTLGAAYGDRAGAGAFPYTVLSASWRCPDDPLSSHYNQVLDATTVTPDWNSAEEMVRSDGLYRWVVFVNHNTAPREPGGGSCIFMHLWSGPTSTTVGCTAMERPNLEAILAWMQPGRTAMVALPEAVYAAQRSAWRLP